VIVEVEGGAQPEIVERAGGAQPVIVERAGGAQPVTVDRTAGQPPAPQEDWTIEPPADEVIKAQIRNDGWIAILAARRNPSARQNKGTYHALGL